MNDRGFSPMSMIGAFPWQFFIAPGYNGGGVKIGFPCNLRKSGLQVIETGKDYCVGADGAPRCVFSDPTFDDCFPFVSVGGALPRHLVVSAGCYGGGVEISFPSNVRIYGLQVVKSGKDCSVGADGAP